MTYDVRNPDPGLGQTQKCAIKLVKMQDYTVDQRHRDMYIKYDIK
jgi:hypothetical protein